MSKVQDSASDVAAYQISVHTFEVGGRKDTPRQNAVSESWSKPLNLILQFLKHVYFRTIRDMTIRPRGVFPCGSAGAIEQTWLSRQNKGPIWVLSASHGLF